MNNSAELLRQRAMELKNLANDIRNMIKDTQNYCQTLTTDTNFDKDAYLREYIKSFCEEMEIDSIKTHLNNALLYKAFVMYTKYNKPKVQEISYHDFERLATSYL